MTAEQIIDLARRTLEVALWMSAPILIAATLVSVLINVVQVMTSIQETTVSTVPRLATVAAAAFLLMPWMLRQLVTFTTHLFSDFSPFAR
ncbi:MAG: flagellar biosynthetic protein FliQ [Acidobacteria bacterium]|nr:flagellar biosynthetic protein FliQ [Acidobacteriota bacterium]MBI3663001.1 flagellar biosynthetic protein FliQ [Acidobacteriota bacterium]